MPNFSALFNLIFYFSLIYRFSDKSNDLPQKSRGFQKNRSIFAVTDF